MPLPAVKLIDPEDFVVDCFVPGKPIVAGNLSTTTAHNRAYWSNSAELKKWKKEIAGRVRRNAPDGIYDGPAFARLTFFLPMLKYKREDYRRGRTEHLWHDKRSDLDKWVRAAFDGIQRSERITDDARIVQLVSEKLYSKVEGGEGLRIQMVAARRPTAYRRPPRGGELPPFGRLWGDRFEVECFVSGHPVVEGNLKTNRHTGKMYWSNDKKLRSWRGEIASEVRRCVPPGTHDGPVIARLTFFLPMTKYKREDYRRGRLEHLWREKYPDLDKLVRAAFDGIQESERIKDDALFTQLVSEKLYSRTEGEEGLHIQVRSAPPIK